jgi:hypothetical protein
LPTDSSLAALLTEYSQDPSQSLDEVAMKLQLAPAHATRLMKKYAYLMQIALEDKDFPTRAATRMGVPNEVAMALESKIDDFADQRVVSHMKDKRNQRNMSQVADQAMQRDERLLEQDFSRDVPLSGSNPVRLLRWVISDLMRHKLDQQTATSFLHLFATDPEYFMNNPMKLEQKMKDLFGNNDGDKAFRQFYELVTTKLGPSQQFGGPAWQNGMAGPFGGPPQPNYFQGGGQNYQPSSSYQPSSPRYAGSNSFLNWYQSKGVIPGNVDPESPEAKRAIEEYEMDKRERRMNEDLNNKMKNAMNQQMIRMADFANLGGGGQMGGGGGGAMNMNQYMPMLMSGMMRVVYRTNPQSGAPETVIERNMGPAPGQPGSMVADGQMGGEGSIIDAATKLMGVLQQNNQVTQMFQPLITKMMEKGMGLAETGGTSSLVQTASDMKQLAEVLGGNNATVSIENRRLDLAEKRIDSDRDVALRQLDQTRSREDKTTDWEHKQEEMSGNRMTSIIDKFGPEALKLVAPLIQTLVESKMMGGMAGGQGGAPNVPPGGMQNMPPGPAYVNDPGQGTAATNEPMSIAGSTPVTNEDLGGMTSGGYGGGGGGSSPGASTYTEYATGAGGPSYAMRTELEREAEIEAQRQAEMARRHAATSNQRRNEAWAEVGRNLQQQQNTGVRQYDPNEFASMTPDQLAQAEQQAKGLVDSAHSLSDAVRTARHNQMLGGMSSQPPQQQQRVARQEQMQQGTEYQAEENERQYEQVVPSNYDPNEPPSASIQRPQQPQQQQQQEQQYETTDVTEEETESGEFAEKNVDYADPGDIGE